LGVSVAPLTPETAERLGAPKNAHGLVVEEVNPDSRAADAGIRPGDVIEQVNRQPVQGVDDLRAAIRRSADKPVLLLINRQGSELTNTATVLSSPARLMSSGVTRLPSIDATASAAPPAAAAIASVLNCRNAASAIRPTPMLGPMNGTTFSAPAMRPHTTACS